MSEDPTDAKPAARGSRRGPKSTAAAGKTAGASKRSNKSKKAISDADLMKAVSQAAEAVGTGPVMELIEEFGVAKVQDIEQANRMEFIERARALGEED